MESCGILIPDASYSFKWKIHDFLVKAQKTGQPINSPWFHIKDSKDKYGECRLKIYPKGMKQDSNYITICLENMSSNVLTASCRFSLVDKNGNKIVQETTKLREFSKRTLSCGFANFYPMNKLKEESSSLLPSGTLTIALDIVNPGPDSPAACLVQDLEHTFTMNRDEFSDMKISSNGKVFNCHRVLLSCRSLVLRAMCQTNFKEGATGEINLDSMDPEIIEEMLSFIYTGKVQNLEANAVELLKAADIYQLDNLKDICCHHLSGKLTKDNCLDNLVLADTYRAHNLKDSSMDVVKKEIQSLMKTPKWMEIRKQHPELMMDLMESTIEQKVL